MAATAPTFTFSQKDTTDCTQIFVVAMRETRVQSLGREDPLEKEVATHSSVLAWRIPGREAWWAAVYGVAQSRTRLKRLSSSSSSIGKMVRLMG